MRNLMNNKISIVAGTLPPSWDGLQLYSISSIKDLITLKSRNSNAAVHHADITPYLRQNCDATVKACPHYKAVSIRIGSDLDQTDSSRIEHVRTRTRSSRIEPVAGVDHVM